MQHSRHLELFSLFSFLFSVLYYFLHEATSHPEILVTRVLPTCPVALFHPGNCSGEANTGIIAKVPSFPRPQCRQHASQEVFFSVIGTLERYAIQYPHSASSQTFQTHFLFAQFADS